MNFWLMLILRWAAYRDASEWDCLRNLLGCWGGNRQRCRSQSNWNSTLLTSRCTESAEIQELRIDLNFFCIKTTLWLYGKAWRKHHSFLGFLRRGRGSVVAHLLYLLVKGKLWKGAQFPSGVSCQHLFRITSKLQKIIKHSSLGLYFGKEDWAFALGQKPTRRLLHWLDPLNIYFLK